jgi:hypothetical protein
MRIEILLEIRPAPRDNRRGFTLAPVFDWVLKIQMTPA